MTPTRALLALVILAATAAACARSDPSATSLSGESPPTALAERPAPTEASHRSPAGGPRPSLATDPPPQPTVAGAFDQPPVSAPSARWGPATLVVGDSITWQWILAGGPLEFPGVDFLAGPAWQFDACSTPVTPVCQPPVDHVRTQAEWGMADRVVWMLGTNDTNEVWDGGWNAADEQVATQALAALPEATCVVVVLPWLGPGARTAHRREVDEARTWFAIAATGLPNAHVVDWGPFAARPGVLDGDGIHLAVDPGTGRITPEAHRARSEVIRRALGTCR